MPNRLSDDGSAGAVGLGRFGGRLLQDDVRVGTGEPERADAGDTRLTVALPRRGLLDHLQRKPVPRNVRRRILEVQMRRQQLVLERQDDLDHARDARGGLQVSDVRLRRADQQWVAVLAPLAEDRTGGLRLDRVTQRRPGAVCLQVVDVGGNQAGTLQRVGDNPLLCNTIRHGQATRRAVLVDRAAADDGPDVVAVGDRVFESLDDDDAATLAAHVTVCGRVERLASTIGREHVRAGEGDHRRRREQHVRATGQCQVALPQTQRLAGLMDGHQRRTARRVDGDRRALQPQPEADPARGCGVRRPDRHVGLDLGERQLTGGHTQVVVGGQTDEHTGIRIRQSRWRSAGMLNRPPRGLQQEPVLWVQHPDLARRHAEERRVETGHVIDETRPTCRDLARCVRVGVEELVDIPPVGRHFGDRVPAFSQHIPELVGVRGSGKTRRVTDDRKTGC